MLLPTDCPVQLPCHLGGYLVLVLLMGHPGPIKNSFLTKTLHTAKPGKWGNWSTGKHKCLCSCQKKKARDLSYRLCLRLLAVSGTSVWLPWLPGPRLRALWSPGFQRAWRVVTDVAECCPPASTIPALLLFLSPWQGASLYSFKENKEWGNRSPGWVLFIYFSFLSQILIIFPCWESSIKHVVKTSNSKRNIKTKSPILQRKLQVNVFCYSYIPLASVRVHVSLEKVYFLQKSDNTI